MHFDKSDLQQLTPEYVGKLPTQRVANLCEQLRQDLVRAHERLNQNPTNSSRPSSSQAPWEPPSASRKEENITAQSDPSTNSNPEKDVSSPQSGSDTERPHEEEKVPPCKPGKQPGAPGFGRTQKLEVTHREVHKPLLCMGCSKQFPDSAPFKATTGFETIDLVPVMPGKIGISGICTKHLFGTSLCECGFETTSKPHRCDSEIGWSIDMGEWKLIGPLLLTFIVFGKIRLHHTIGKTQEILKCWFGITLSKGAIGNALSEAGLAASCLEPSILEALRTSGLIHIDETSWKEKKVTRWLWVAVGHNVVYFTVGSRGAETARAILGDFAGHLMSDGYGVYRSFKNRCRCWAHLDRKAQGLAESWDKSVASFGQFAVRTLKALEHSVYRMRDLPAFDRAGELASAENLEAQFNMEVLRRQNSLHETTAQFCREIINDPEAIFSVLRNPDLPLTNNVAERALRPMVILRKISHGSKTPEGSRVVALLASAYETVQIRTAEIQNFFSTLFRTRRSGLSPPVLPAA